MKNTVTNYLKTAAVSIWMNVFGYRGELRDLKTETALIFPGDLPIDVCDNLVARIDSALSHEDHPRVWRDATASDSRILGFERDIPELLTHFDIDRRIAAVDAYTGGQTKLWFLMANRVVPKDHNLGSGGGWHRDSPFSHQVKFIWYLSDVSPMNGPFEYVPGTNANLLQAGNDYPLGQSRFKTVCNRVAEVSADAGTLLVCDTKCVHRGKPITSGARYALTLYTFNSAAAAAEVLRNSGLNADLATPAQGGWPS